jgi:hypothetical protein
VAARARLGPWLAVASLGAGIARRDCALIAAAGPVALAAFYLRMDAEAPVDAFRAAIRCVLAGVSSLIAAVALLVVIALAIHGAWTPGHDHYFGGVAVLGASIGALVLTMFGDEVAGASGVQLLALAASAFGIGLAFALATDRAEWSLCALPVATAALMGLAGWRLLGDVATGMLGSSRRFD